MLPSASEPFILLPPKHAGVPYTQYPSLGLPTDANYLLSLILLPVCVLGLLMAVTSFRQTQDEIAHSAYTTATFVEAARRPGVCRYVLEFRIEDGRVHRAKHVQSPGKHGCAWSAGERVRLRYVRTQPDQLKLLEPTGDWTLGEVVLMGLFLGSFTFIPCFIMSTVFFSLAFRRLLLRYRGRPLIGELIELEVSPHTSSIRFRGTRSDFSGSWISSYTIDVTYRVRTEEGLEVSGKHSLHRGEGSFTAPRPGSPLLIMYAGPRLHRAL